MDQQNNPSIPPTENPVTPPTAEPVVPQNLTPTENTVTLTSPLEVNQTSKVKVSPLLIGMGVLLVVLLLVIGFLGYNNMQLRSEVENIKMANATLEAEKATLVVSTPTPTPDPMADWETYVTPNEKYSISYPPDWSLETSSDDEWTASVGSPNFTLSNNGYEMNFSFPSSFGPSICIFSDSPDFDKVFPEEPIRDSSKCPGNYVEIETNDSVYRRIEAQGPSRPGKVTWYIFKNVNETFTSVPPITFYTPVDYEDSVLKEMDQILSTFEFTE